MEAEQLNIIDDMKTLKSKIQSAFKLQSSSESPSKKKALLVYEGNEKQNKQTDELKEIKRSLVKMFTKQQDPLIASSDNTNPILSKLSQHIGSQINEKVSQQLMHTHEKVQALEQKLHRFNEGKGDLSSQKIMSAEKAYRSLVAQQREALVKVKTGGRRKEQPKVSVDSDGECIQEETDDKISGQMTLNYFHQKQQKTLTGDLVLLSIKDKLALLEAQKPQLKDTLQSGIAQKLTLMSQALTAKPQLRLTERDSIDFHNPALVKVNLTSRQRHEGVAMEARFSYENVLDKWLTRTKFEMKIKSRNNMLEDAKAGVDPNFTQNLDEILGNDNQHQRHDESKSPTESNLGLNFMDYSPDSAGKVLRQRLVRDFTSIDKLNLKVKTRFQAFKHPHEGLSGRTSKEVVLRESNVTQFKYVTEGKGKKQGLERFEFKQRSAKVPKEEECLFILVTKEFEMSDEDILLRGGNTHFQHDLHDLSVQSRFSPRGYNNDDKQFNDSYYDEDGLQQPDLRDHMFIDLMGGGAKSLRNSNDLQHDQDANARPFQKEEANQTKFYEEEVEDESYDQELIEELFNSKKKFKISKTQVEKLQEQIRVSSDENLDSQPDTLSGLQTRQGKTIRRQTIREKFLPYSDLEQEDQQIRRKSSKRKLDINTLVEFFDPIKSKKTLSKKTMTKTKDKGSTQKHGVTSKKVPADSSTQEAHGQITFYGNVHKQRFKYNKFHLRWVVLRGFNLYWYRSPVDKQQKGMIVLPSQQIQPSRVGQNVCFQIVKEEGASSGRQLKFLDNDQNREFKCKIANTIAFKLYMEACQRKSQKLDPQIVSYFNDFYLAEVVFRDKYLNEEHKIIQVFEALTMHVRLKSLVLVNCGISDDSLELLLYKLKQTPSQLQHLDLTQNDLTHHSISSLCQYMKHDFGRRLDSLILNRNTIYDSGIQRLAVGLFERFQLFENTSRQLAKIQLPIKVLGLSDTKFSDNGLKYMLQRFEAIYLMNIQSQKEFEGYIDLDISKNNITESSMKYMADILRKFQGFHSLNLSYLAKMKDQAFIEIARALKENYSLVRLDISKNSLSQLVMMEMFQSLQQNYVLSELIIDIKAKYIPSGFSSNIISSMYEGLISREAVFL